MHIRRICIDQFGSWSHLQLNDLASGLVVLYGTNGSGKSTIAQFIRSTFCGLDAAAQRRLADPHTPGRVGSLTIRNSFGERTLQRFTDGQEGRLSLLDPQGEELTDPRQLGPLFASPPAHWDRVFWVDFERRPDLRQLIDQAWEQGFEFAESPARLERLQQLERTVQSHRTALDALPRVGQTASILRERQQQVQRQLERLAVLWAQGETDQRQLSLAWEQERQRLQRQHDALLAERQQLDERLNQMRREHLRPAPSSLSSPSSGDSRRAHLAALDSQLQRWRGVLEEIVERRRALEQQSGVAPGLTHSTIQETPHSAFRLWEQRLERLLQDVSRLSTNVVSPVCQCAELKTQWGPTLQVLRQQIGQLSGEIGSWEKHAGWRDTTHESYRLQRCEDELRSAIGGLLRERSELLDELAGHGSQQPSRGPDTALGRLPSVAAGPAAGYGHRDPTTSAERESLEQRHRQISAALDEVRANLATDSTSQGRSAADEAAHRRQSDELLAEHRRLQEAIGSEERCHGLREQIARLEAEVRDLRAAETIPQVILDASHHLRRLTGESLVELRVQPDRTVQVTDRRGESRGTHQLASGEGDQVYMSLALAMVTAWRRRGVRPPLVWDDACMHLDLVSARAAAQLLSDLARDGQQVLLFTRHEAVADVLRQLGADVRSLQDTRIISQPPVPVALPLPDHGRGPLETLLPAAPTVREPPLPQLSNRAHSEYFLTEEHPIEDAPSVDGANAERMRTLGLTTIGDLLHVLPDELAQALAGVTPPMVRVWQAEAGLVCGVPRLRGFDARILVACGIMHPETLLQIDPDELRERVEQFARTSEGRILLGVGTEYEVSRLLDWVRARHRSRSPRSQTRDMAEARDIPAAEDRHSRQPPFSTERLPRRRRTVESMRGDERRDERRGADLSEAYRVVPEADEDETPVTRPELVSSPSTSRRARAARYADGRVMRFYLDANDPVADSPSIGTRMAEALTGIGIGTVRQLLRADPAAVAEQLGNRRVKGATIRAWQHQAELVCRIPELRGHDAQILVACGITDPESLAAADPEQLTRQVAEFVTTAEGKRTLRGGELPDREEITNWFRWSEQARSLHAA